jgi:hypothetical protein
LASTSCRSLSPLMFSFAHLLVCSSPLWPQCALTYVGVEPGEYTRLLVPDEVPCSGGCRQMPRPPWFIGGEPWRSVVVAVLALNGQTLEQACRCGCLQRPASGAGTRHGRVDVATQTRTLVTSSTYRPRRSKI